jgi:plasmid stabilization system protein ParE
MLFSPEAEEDFRAVIEFLVARNPVAAAALADRIFSVLDQLAAGDFDVSVQPLG